MVDRMTRNQALACIKNGLGKGKRFSISTDFGVCDITKKEAIRMVETCEWDTIVVSISPGNPPQFILEYAE